MVSAGHMDKQSQCLNNLVNIQICCIYVFIYIYLYTNICIVGVLNGISTSKNIIAAGHMDKRSQCLNDLVKIYQKNPLVRSHLIVDSVSNVFTNFPSTLGEYISSDLWKFS
jgi:hypothetical protein